MVRRGSPACKSSSKLSKSGQFLVLLLTYTFLLQKGADVREEEGVLWMWLMIFPHYLMPNSLDPFAQLTTYPCLTTALASCQAVSLRVVSGRVKKSIVTNLNLYPYSQSFTISTIYLAITRCRYTTVIPSSIWPPGFSVYLHFRRYGLSSDRLSLYS